MKKIANRNCLLISTPMLNRTFPRSIVSIASFLETQGYTAEVVHLAHYLGYNSDWSFEEVEKILKDIIQDRDPSVVGISNQVTADYPMCEEIAKICKKLNEDIVTVVGGLHVTFLDEESAGSPFIDFIVRSEGEWTMLELLSTLENGTDLEQVKGITFKKNGETIRTPNRPMGELSKLPSLNLGLMPAEFYQKAFMLGMINRGCTNHCTYCAEGAFWKRRRSFPVDYLIDELKTLNRVYNTSMNGIEDSMIFLGSSQFSEMCNKMKENEIFLKPDFYIMSRVDSVNDKGLRDVKDTGISKVCLGIESGSPKVLKLMNKRIDRDQVLSACTKLRENDLNPVGMFMFGHPGETLEDAEQTLELLAYLIEKDLIAIADLYVFVPFPGTPFFKNPEKYGVEILTYKWADWYQYGVTNPVYRLADFPPEDIISCYHRAFEIAKAGGAEADFWTEDNFPLTASTGKRERMWT
ncbi:MAG: B12-binding domain-containing radical SAM protein [Desulfobacteraceae bacterium]|nr:B12-binding domain-containing radical SAM protein [Desulfobacteraceae bacterium]